LRPADPGAVVPQLAFGSCSFQPPGDARVDCGTLVLPRNRTQPTASSIALPFAVFRATNPAPDPVIYLSGGPGGAALAAAAGNYRSWRAFAPGRDFIFVDQRGTGVGWPGLYCPELRGAGSRLAGLDAARAEADALLRCRDRFAAQGVAMADFTSAASAADLDTLRAALGYQRWNLFGISYGTRLALTMLRDNPSSIRSVVLDSPYPPQENLYTAMPPTLDQSLRTLFTDCAANAGCNAAYPDLETVFYSLIERLNAQPQSATLYGSRTTLSGDRLLDVMFRLFYRTTIIPRLPQAIYAASNGDFGPFAELTAARGGGAGQAQALYYAIQCAEELSFVSPQEMQSAVNAFPRLAGFYAGLLETSAIGLDFCARFTSATPDPRENQPVVSDTPVLIFAGAYDPITPPQWRDSAAATLSRSYGYTFPATGHAVIGRGACPISIVRSFFAAPEQAPDAGCVGQVGPPAFVLP
jgi:pimeloyl-ACP methyl ester carboxylesterase